MHGFFKLHSSYILSALLFFSYSLAILTVFILPVMVLAKAAIAVLLACALFYYLCRDAWLLLPSSPVAIRLEGRDITLLTRGGNELQGQLLDSSVVTPVIAILNISSRAPNVHDDIATPDNEVRHARFPLSISLPQAGERGEVSLREFYVKDMRHVLVFQDSMGKELFRELRVLLKWGA